MVRLLATDSDRLAAGPHDSLDQTSALQRHLASLMKASSLPLRLRGGIKTSETVGALPAHGWLHIRWTTLVTSRSITGQLAVETLSHCTEC